MEPKSQWPQFSAQFCQQISVGEFWQNEDIKWNFLSHHPKSTLLREILKVQGTGSKRLPGWFGALISSDRSSYSNQR